MSLYFISHPKYVPSQLKCDLNRLTEKFVPFSLKANYLIVSNVSACKPCMLNVNVNLTIWRVLLESLVIDKAKQNKTGIF